MHPALAFLLGVLCGLSLALGRSSFRGLMLRLKNPLGEDELYLLCAARLAAGRLILMKGAPGGRLILKEFEDARPMENRGQIQRLLARQLIAPDPSGLSERFILTQAGWDRIRKLPAPPLQMVRKGNWFNSVSGKQRRPARG